MPTLILVDGFAGTGKSTAAQRLWLDLTRSGRDAVWFHEHERAHPVFEYGEIEDLLRDSPGRFERKVTRAWQSLAASTGGPAVRIVEGAFLQIPVGVMTAMGAPAPRVRAFVRSMDAMLGAAGASLVYLHQPNIARSLQRTGRLRGPQWLLELTAAVGASPYGQRHSVKNFRGLTKFYERQRAIVDAVMPHLAMRRLALDVSGGAWNEYARAIAAFTGIRRTADPALTRGALLNHAGEYRSASGLPAVIATDGHRLYAHLPATRPLALLPVSPKAGHFCAEGLPIDVRFERDRRGRARRFVYESRMTNEVLSETTWARA